MVTKKPTIDDIRALYTKCKRIYSGLHSQFEEDEKYYELDFHELLDMPEEFKDKGIILPTCRDMVDTCVDHTDISNARVFVNRMGISKDSMETQRMMRKFYLGLINRTETESTISPWRVGDKHYWLHGLGVFKTVWDADRTPGKPEQQKGESDEDYAVKIDNWRADNHSIMPIVIQGINPHNIMLDPYEGGNRFVFEVSEQLVFDVEQKYPNWSNPLNRTADKTVLRVSFWTPDWRCELYDWEPILPFGGVVKHKYGFIPYVPIDSGLGNMDYKADPQKRYVGVLRYIRELAVSESRNYSISDVVLAKEAWPWGIISGPGNERVKDLDQSFGSYTHVPEGVKIEQQTPQLPPEALNRHLDRTSGYITSHAAPNSVRGLGEAGVRSGADRRQVIAEASTRYAYSNQAFKNGTAKVLTNCAKLMKNVIPGDVRVWAHTPTDEFDIVIEKDKMQEPFTCYVEFAPISEEDEYRRHDDLERLVTSTIATKQWARSRISTMDPEQMAIDEEKEKIMNDPAVQAVFSQYAAGKAAEVLAARSAAESLKNPPPPVPAGPTAPPTGPPTQQGQPPIMRSMVPPIPNVAPLGSAQNMQNQMQNMRRPVPINQQGQGGGGNTSSGY